MTEHREVTVLVVDDDEVDVLCVKRGFEKRRIANPMVIAGDGQEALDILRGENGQSLLEPPYIVLLDINMPRMDGLEFLKQLRADEKLKKTVVFVLTTSDLDADRLGAYEYNVAGYMCKKNAGEAFMKAVEMLDHYWRVVALP